MNQRENTNPIEADAVAKPTPARRSGRVVRRLAAGALLVLIVLGLAAPAQAVGLYKGNFAANTYYGVASGTGYVPTTFTRLGIDGFLRDARNDGYCSTIQMRVEWNDGSRSRWFNAGFNCSTTTGKYFNYALTSSGGGINGGDIRLCQSNRYGTVVGTCSGYVEISRWLQVS